MGQITPKQWGIVSSYSAVFACYIIGGALSGLGLVSIAGILMWPPICLGGYIAEHTTFIASMAGIDSFWWKCMLYLVALTPVSLLLRIVVKVWWRLIGYRMFHNSVLFDGREEQMDEFHEFQRQRAAKGAASIEKGGE